MPSSALVALGQALRTARAAGIHTDVTVRCGDGDVCLQHPVACAISPFLAAALNGDFLEGHTRTIQMPDVDAATLELALDFMCGGDVHINGENATRLLFLADRLLLEPLRAACEKVLSSLLTTLNAPTIAEAAEACGCPDLAAVANSLLTEESSTLHQLLQRRHILQHERRLAEAAIVESSTLVASLQKRTTEVQAQYDFELDRIFRATAAATAIAESGGGAAAYPHEAQAILVVNPNAGHDLMWELPSRLKSLKRSSATASASPREYGSLMEAYDAARPGDVLQLLSGNHVLDECDADGRRSWSIDFLKAVQLVGISPDETVLSIRGENMSYEGYSLIKSEFRLANLTLDCSHMAGGYSDNIFSVGKGAGLWLDNVVAKLAGPLLDMGSGASAVIRGCLLVNAEVAAVFVHPSALTLFVEHTTFSGCSTGTRATKPTRRLYGNGPRGRDQKPHYLEGECAAIQMHEDLVFVKHRYNNHTVVSKPAPEGPIVSAMVTIRNSVFEANFGPAVGFRTDTAVCIDFCNVVNGREYKNEQHERLDPPLESGPFRQAFILSSNKVRDNGVHSSHLVGQRVKLHSIEARPELNGQWGVVLSYHEATGRVGVRADGAKKLLLALKPANLMPLVAQGTEPLVHLTGEQGEHRSRLMDDLREAEERDAHAHSDSD